MPITYTVTVCDSRTEWYHNGKLHREDGPASEWTDGTKLWYRHGKKHREDGPAVECPDSCKVWYRHGRLHREDGPAVLYNRGHKMWYLDNVQMTEEEHKHRTSPAKELTVAEIEKLLGYRVKIIKE